MVILEVQLTHRSLGGSVSLQEDRGIGSLMVPRACVRINEVWWYVLQLMQVDNIL